MTVHPIFRFEFEVKARGYVEIVDIREKTCSCKNLDLQQLPCAYALTTCRHVHMSYNSLYSYYYTTDVHVTIYVKPIYPVGNDCDWLVPLEIREFNIKLPREQPHRYVHVMHLDPVSMQMPISPNDKCISVSVSEKLTLS